MARPERVPSPWPHEIWYLGTYITSRLGETRDLLHLCSQYIDFLKLGFGTSALYTPEVLEKKIQLVKSFGIEIYPGGTFLEIAILQNKLAEYLHLAKGLGFTAIEISDGTIALDGEVREKMLYNFISLPGILAIIGGALATCLNSEGLKLLQVEPEIIFGLVIRSIFGITFLGGIPVGPLMAAGLAAFFLNVITWLRH